MLLYAESNSSSLWCEVAFFHLCIFPGMGDLFAQTEDGDPPILVGD